MTTLSSSRPISSRPAPNDPGAIEPPATDRVPARERYTDNVYFQDGMVLTGILIVLLYLVLAISLDAAGYVENLSLLVPVTLGALALGFLMSFSRFDGFFALSHSMFTGLAWILLLMTGLVTRADTAPFVNNGIPELQARSYFVLLRWLNWVDSAINNAASNDNYVFVFEMCFLVWWLAYLGVWSVLRYGYTWRAIIPAGLVLLINTYYAPKSILGFLIVFCLVALLLFVRTNLAEQQLRWREQRVYFNQDITLDFLRNGLMYSVLVIALAWIAPGLGRSVEVRTVMAPLNDRWQQTTERWNKLYQGLNRQTRPVGSAFGRTLSLGGARHVTGDYVFRVDAPIGRYWRAVVYDTFTGREWLSTGETEKRFDADKPVPVADWAMREPLTQTITLMEPTGNILFGAPDIERASIAMDALVRSAPDSQAGKGAVEISIARSRRPLDTGDSYTIISNYTAVTQRALESASTEYPADILDRYLQLPDNFSSRVAAEAKTRTAGLTTEYDKAKALETYLRTIPYNDNIEAPPENTDPVEYFLYDIKQGYCDYYATAMVVMLRSLGIPARVVSGYAEGRYDQQTRQYYITERDAHTWVETYFPGYGWIEFEPTAGETSLNRPSGVDATGSGAPDNPSNGSAAAANSPQDSQDPSQADALQNQLQNEFGNGQGVGGRRLWWLWAILTPLVLIAGGWLVWRAKVMGPTMFDADLPPIFFDRLQTWAARLGLRPPPSQTPYEQAKGLANALPEGRPSIASITDIYVHYRWSRQAFSTLGQGQGDAQINSKLFGSWERLRPILWKAWLRKVIKLRIRSKKDPFTLVKE